MITRIVKMHFRDDAVGTFRMILKEKRAIIASQEGCLSLQIVVDSAAPYIIFTISEWVSEAHLERYRQSAFFKETWAFTKSLFAQEPQVWSTVDLTD